MPTSVRWSASSRPASHAPCVSIPGAMGLILTATAGLCLWIVLWSIGVKALDGMILVLLIVVLSVAVKMLSAYLPGQRSE